MIQWSRDQGGGAPSFSQQERGESWSPYKNPWNNFKESHFAKPPPHSYLPAPSFHNRFVKKRLSPHGCNECSGATKMIVFQCVTIVHPLITLYTVLIGVTTAAIPVAMLCLATAATVALSALTAQGKLHCSTNNGANVTWKLPTKKYAFQIPSSFPKDAITKHNSHCS